MNKLMLKFDFGILDNTLTDYLSTINGISLVEINDDELYIEFDKNIISFNVLRMEVLLYLNVLKVPSLIAFDKYFKTNVKNYTFLIKDLCCEYCLMGLIENLYNIDGIISAYSDFDYCNKYGVNIFITYDSEIVSLDLLEELDRKFNLV